jgi:hypothetical protein
MGQEMARTMELSCSRIHIGRFRKSMMIAYASLKIRTNYIQNTSSFNYGLPNPLDLIAYVGHILFSS